LLMTQKLKTLDESESSNECSTVHTHHVGSFHRIFGWHSNSVGPSSLLDTKLTWLTCGRRARQLIMPSGP
jgi:hypothetical protein